MDNREKAIAMARELVYEMGYILFDETPEQFAARLQYNVDLLQVIMKGFAKYKRG